MLLNTLEFIGVIIAALLGLIILCIGVFALAVVITTIAKEIKEEVQEDERKRIK